MGTQGLVVERASGHADASEQVTAIELWGGVECTVNRVGDVFHDQMEWSGHATRLDDLDRFAALGLRALRYPILWERIAPEGLQRAEWGWADERLGRLRELGIRPIVTLLHHGSGPRHTSLVSPNFAPELAAFARAVAERYPWVEDYTPINEPLTTARFSGLYGHWYPHGRDDLTFLTALLNECAATATAMRAIRSVNPGARLVQTEEVGKTYSTPPLAYQAGFENERRWLSLDLLCGRVGPEHPLWDYLLRGGIDPALLAPLREDPCPPDLIGVNYYPTSDRFLDERCERYPAWQRGGNGRDRYADTEAVRVRTEGLTGHLVLLREAWERYQLPLAVSEVHLAGPREEQLRWLWDAWQAAADAREAGVDIRAITVWSLLGVFDWHTLVTRVEGFYEPGAFDLRSPQPRSTAIARLIRTLATRQSIHEPVLATPGWWHRPDRFFYPPVSAPGESRWSVNAGRERERSPAAPLLILGDDRGLGGVFAHHCQRRALAHRLVRESELTGGFPMRELATHQPWGIIDTRGAATPMERAGAGSDDPAVVAALAGWCAEHGVALLSLSSGAVFGATSTAPAEPFVESDPVCPVDPAGQAAVERERRQMAAYRLALIVRTGPLFALSSDLDSVTQTLDARLMSEAPPAPGDAVVSPTYAPDAVDACLDLLIDGEQGVWHVANTGATTWSAFVEQVAMHLDATLAHRDTPEEEPNAGESVYRALGSERGRLLGSVEDALERHFGPAPLAVEPGALAG